MMSKNYDSNSIETLRFPDNVRKNPSMYIGGTDAHGLFVILRELADNAVDEYLAGRNKFAAIKIDADGSYWVQDGGSGIPQGTKTVEVNVNGKIVKSNMPTMQAVFGELHTSGKFRSEAYAVSIGSHGVGVKGTNATSQFFDVLTCYKDKWFKIGFKQGKLSSPVSQSSKAPVSPFTGKPMTKGTLVHFKPDASIFSVKSFPPQMLVEWAEVQAYLNPGLQVVVSVKGKQKTWISKEGPKEYISKRLASLKAEAEADMFEFRGDLAHAVVAFSNADGFELRGYTNGLTNSQGGKHVDSVANALFQAVKLHAGAKQEFSAADFRDGMVGIVNAKLHKAAFSSQDKAKLTDDRMGKDFLDMVLIEAKKFFASNKAMAKRLCDRAAKINELKTKFKASKAVATELNKVKKQGLPPNYAPAHRSVPVAQRELFIVEGDSAAGGFRKVREKHQALLPLKGKIMNCFAPETLILMQGGGSVQISELQSGEWGGYGYNVGISARSNDLMSASFVSSEVSELLELTLSDGNTIRCTPDHLFLTEEEGYVRAVDLENYHTLVTVLP
jgi:DNA gyrase/topoisomerase IV subunit B